jgi:hypothetical protein
MVALALFLLVGMPFVLIDLPPNADPLNVILLILLLLLTIAILGFVAACISNFYSDIQVFDQGLKIQVFCFWWVSISWEDIEDIRASLWGFSQSYVVVVHKLTSIHRFIGFSYGTFFKPAFIISKKLNGYNELVGIINERLAKA